jgi:hypothetical protein
MPATKESFKAVADYLSKVFTLTCPGLLLCDVVFKKGLLNGGISDVYTFILVIFWSLILSVPYYVATTLTMLTHDTSVTLDAKEDDPTLYEAVLPLTVLLTVLTYILLKVLNYFNFGFISAKLGTPIRFEQMVVAVIAIFVLAFPIGNIYYRTLDFFMRKCVERQKHLQSG